MDENENIIGYHGTSLENKESILKNGFEASKAGQNHWLGKGTYFYDNIYYAIEWGIIFFAKKDVTFESYKKKVAIIKGKLNLDDANILYLNDPLQYDYYIKILENIKERFPEKINTITIKEDVQLINLIEEIEEELGEKLISEFDIVMADYPKDIYKKGRDNIAGNFLPCIQKQICVKNNNIIEEISNINLDTPGIKQIWEIVKKNREEHENEKKSRTIRKDFKQNKKYTRQNNRKSNG